MHKTKIKIISIVGVSFASLLFFSDVRAETVRIGFVSDWEYGSQKKHSHKFPRKAEQYLKAAVKHFNGAFLPDLVVGGGDYILSSGISKKKAKKQLKRINGFFRAAGAPRRYCIGNHDLADLSKNEVQEILGIDASHSVTDLNGVRIITLDTNQIAAGRKGYGVEGRMSAEELAWLDEQVNTSLPVILFSHHSPIQTPQGKNLRTNILGGERVSEILEKYGNVAAVFSGHHAINYSEEKNGINYVIVNNLTDQRAQGTYVDITVQNSDESGEIDISVSQYGKRPASYNFSKTISIN